MLKQTTQTATITQDKINLLNTNSIVPMVSITITVLDGSGEPAINASFRETGTDNYATTDFDGVVTLNNVSSYSTVEVNYQGLVKKFPVLETPDVVKFSTEQLPTVYLTNKKRINWYTVGTVLFGLATIGFVAKSIVDDKKPLKVSL